MRGHKPKSGAVLLLALLLASKCLQAEWVDLPSFSQQRKLYGQPISFDRRYHQAESDFAKFGERRPVWRYWEQDERNDRDGRWPSRGRPGSFVYNRDEEERWPTTMAMTTTPSTERFVEIGIRRPTSFHENKGLRNVSEISSDRRSGYSQDDESTVAGTIATLTTERIVSGIVEEDERDTIAGDPNVDAEIEPSNPAYVQSEELTISDDPKEDPTPGPTGSTPAPKVSECKDKSDNENDFLDYLPVDLLKRVHKTLKSQPPTLKGKIRFLKEFERTLLSEIESRLSAALAPTRIPRGARGHDDGIGFPSLEGTLMAISFLTFAVYLVKLVMMLFKNPQHHRSATMYVGRRKRSIDDANEETARILSYLDNIRSHNHRL